MCRIIIVIFLLILQLTSSAKVRVLTVGISEYPAGSGWNRINAHNDVELISSISDDVIILENKDATYSNINKALKKLESKVLKGDTVIVHFSGHGQQIISLNSEKEVDGVDEAFVSYDALKKKTPGYNGEAHFTDDEFGAHINKLRAKVGYKGLVIALIDACHSDSMDKAADKSEAIYRGTDDIFGAELLSKKQIKQLKELYNNKDNSRVIKDGKLSEVIYFSACSSQQRNYEIRVGEKGYGPLSYYFQKVLKEHGLCNLPEFMTLLYDSMRNNKTMLFRGQTPAIRTTFDWSVPERKTIVVKNLSTDIPLTSGIPAWIWYVSAGVICLIIVLLVVWRKKKVNQ